MNFFENYDQKLLLKFLDMKEDESLKILIITGPYNSGKTTLRRLVETYNGNVPWTVNDPITYIQPNLPPECRSIMTSHFSLGDLEYVCRSCLSIMKQERSFRKLYSMAEQKFSGNQTVIEIGEEIEFSNFFQRNDIMIFRTKKLEKPQTNFRTIKKDFILWLSNWRTYYDLTPIILQLILLKKYRSTILNSLPKDVFRLLIQEIISTPYKNIHNKELQATMIKF